MHFGSTLWFSSLSTTSFNKSIRLGYIKCFYSRAVLLSLLTFFLLTCSSAPEPPVALPMDKRSGLSLSSKINLYDHPGGELTQTLAPNDAYQFTGRYSSDLYWRKTGSDTLLEPYLEVMLADSSYHWAYANPNYYQLSIAPQQWQWNNRLRTILSPDQWRNYQQLQRQWQTDEAHTPLLLLFQATRTLRDELQEALRPYPPLPLHTYENVLPACISYYQDGKPAWWLDYNQWRTRASAQNTSAEQALFSFYQEQVYPPDGIEYSYPAWQFPVSSEKAHSLLGRGQHLGLLQDLDSLQQEYPFVNAEWDRVRTYLIRDLTAPEMTYWEPWSVVDSTLTTILQYPWNGLSQVDLDRIALQQERLRQQGEHGTQFDFRNR